VSVKNDSKKWCIDNRLIGFALCVVLGRVDMDDTRTSSCSFMYRLTFEYDGRTQILYNHNNIENCSDWKGRDRFLIQDHTFVWKNKFDFQSIDHRLLDADSFTLEFYKPKYLSYSTSNVMVKECGICPLYSQKKIENGCNSLLFSNNDIEGPSGSSAA
jgi:hypothetical protein